VVANNFRLPSLKTKIPYNLPRLLAAPLTTIVYFVEGEGCADSLTAIGQAD
jgi:hypothetical protein